MCVHSLEWFLCVKLLSHVCPVQKHLWNENGSCLKLCRERTGLLAYLLRVRYFNALLIKKEPFYSSHENTV